MFSTEKWALDFAAMKIEIETSADKSWLRTVNLRYAEFLAGQIQRSISAIIMGLETAGPDAENDKKFCTYFSDELMAAASTLHAASALVRGNVIVPNPLECEAMMRVHNRASKA